MPTSRLSRIVAKFASNVELELETGEVLDDRSETGRKRPWKEKHLAGLIVADAFRSLGLSHKAERCRECGAVLIFWECFLDSLKKLKQANFCRERLCPMCTWRRSLRLVSDVSRVLHAAHKKNPRRKYIMLTLTMKNVKNLKDAIDELLYGWMRIKRKKEFCHFAGGLRVVEVTCNRQTGEWHPHVHALLWVRSSYWNRGYIKQSRWRMLWREALRVDYLPVVEVHVIRRRQRSDALHDAAKEVGKYVVKDSDIVPTDAPEEEIVNRVAILDAALRGRRLIEWWGELRTIAKAIKAENPEDADLIHINDDGLCDDRQTCTVCGAVLVEHVYRWINSLREYVG